MSGLTVGVFVFLLESMTFQGAPISGAPSGSTGSTQHSSGTFGGDSPEGTELEGGGSPDVQSVALEPVDVSANPVQLERCDFTSSGSIMVRNGAFGPYRMSEPIGGPMDFVFPGTIHPGVINDIVLNVSFAGPEANEQLVYDLPLLGQPSYSQSQSAWFSNTILDSAFAELFTGQNKCSYKHLVVETEAGLFCRRLVPHDYGGDCGILVGNSSGGGENPGILVGNSIGESTLGSGFGRNADSAGCSVNGNESSAGLWVLALGMLLMLSFRKRSLNNA